MAKTAPPDVTFLSRRMIAPVTLGSAVAELGRTLVDEGAHALSWVDAPHGAWYTLLAVAVAVGVHLGLGRRTILSVGIGTAVYVVLPGRWCSSSAPLRGWSSCGL
jgi:hypothetical protein